MEKILRDSMVKHLLTNDLFSRHQHGFMYAKSCVTNLLEVLDIVTEALSDGDAAILILLDFAKAFDRVTHAFLLHKLAGYGFSADLINWITNFLSNRKQRVVMGDVYSDWVDVLSGVPQGSVIGPLLFLIYINDLPDVVNNFCKLFADDSQLVARIRNIQDFNSVQSDLDSLAIWSNLWCMDFNINKCSTLKFGSNKTYLQNNFTMADKYGNRLSIIDSRVERNLGVMFDDKLKWSNHIQHIALKANTTLGILRKTFKKWNASLFVKLYTSTVRPILEYCAPIWNSISKQDIQQLEKVQRRATKLVPQIRSLNYKSRLANLGLTTLNEVTLYNF